MNQVTTYDGRQVDSSSEAWRAHCEAATLLRWSLHDRRVHMQGVKAKRGDQAHQELADLISAMWKHQQASKMMTMDDAERADHLDKLERATNPRMRSDVEMIYQVRMAA